MAYSLQVTFLDAVLIVSSLACTFRVVFLAQLQFLPGETSVLYLLNTTDDNLVETPDETLTVAVYVPGMFPSFLGDLIAVVNIEV